MEKAASGGEPEVSLTAGEVAHSWTALALLDQLDLPVDTPHLAALRHVLAAGHENHHRSPGARDEAVRSCL
ncbi:hypothetical protein [Streptomyces sp. NPDC090298]|uniref:hypothetical protein n=1 Tax=Streptomyces sp. NPDC090298 TaxID=3365959 RepID=UPI003829A445